MNFLLKWLIFVLFSLLNNIRPAFAFIDNTAMMVAVDVVGDCTIRATPLLFGVYNPDSCVANQSTARLKVLCTLNTPYYVTLDQGAGYDATTRLRRMSGPDGYSIAYTLSQNPSCTINWGNVLGVDAKFGIGSGLAQTLVVYGQIPPKQNVKIGSYRDIVNVNIIF